MLTFTFQRSFLVSFTRTKYSNFGFCLFCTHVVDPTMAHVCSLGLQIHYYLDDWLLRNQQTEHLRSQTQCPLHLTTLCSILRLEKSEFTPTQDCLHWHTFLNRSEADVSTRGSVQRCSMSCSLSHPSKVWDSSRFSVTAGETGVNVRLGSPRLSQVSPFAALPVSSLASQSGPGHHPVQS